LNSVRRIAKNSLVLLAAQAISMVLGFIYTIYAARYLGAEGFGILSFAVAFTGMFGLLGDLGLSTLATREISRDETTASKYLGNITSIKVFLVVITFGLTALTINILDYPQQTIKVVYIMALSTLLAVFGQTFNSVFQAFEKLEYISISKVLTSILMLVGALIAINHSLNIIYFASIYLIANATALIYNVFICTWKFVLPTLKLEFPLWKEITVDALPFWLTSVFVIIYFRIDIIMLSIMNGDSVVGWYSASYKLIDALIVIPGIFMSAMYPVFSKFYIHSKDSLVFSFNKSFKFLALIAIPIGIGTTVLAEEIILAIYGTEFSQSVIALQILIWANVLGFVNYAPATFFNSTNKQRTLMIVTFFGAVLNISLNFILIPLLSYKGAAIATVSTEFVVGLLLMYQIQKEQNIYSVIPNTLFKPLIAGIAMGLFILIFKNYSLILLICSASIFYFVSLFIINGFEKDDIKLLSQALRR
jgi:O-antigen/teichoic acid export membrane protein